MVNVKIHQYNLILAGCFMMTYNKSVATFSLYLIRICLLSRGSQVQGPAGLATLLSGLGV